MHRKIDDVLEQWAQQTHARPFLLRGARRVGKTHAVKTLGERTFPRNHIYCDFQANLERLNSIFDDPSNINRITDGLSLLYDSDIVEGSTLIIFDEIQLSEKALNSLRFFAQTKHRVIATGSQLGVSIKGRSLPFPSDVTQETLRPMDFEEFLWALGKERMARAIRNSFANMQPFAFHEDALDLYRTYCVVGGMPSVVKEYVAQNDLRDIQSLQAEIDLTYTADMALYAPTGSAAYIQATWTSIPKQLARENTRKFKYTDVASGGRERTYREPLAWLEAAELVRLNYQTNDYAAPLVARNNGSFFKAYVADTGIMYYKLNLLPKAYLEETSRKALSPAFRGALAENYCMQALLANGLETFYWTPGTTSQNEIEFVVQNGLGRVIPIEVKSGKNVQARSLVAYMGKSGAPCGIRLSTRNFGSENGILSVPLYAAHCIERHYLDSFA